MRQKINLLLLFLGLLHTTYAQLPDGNGGHPTSVKWRSINTRAVKVIYPEGMDSTAQNVTNTINYIFQNQTQSIGYNRRKIDLVLQTNQVQSNGYVALAPFRSEFYLTPPQDRNMLGSLDWTTTLSIHEYRHALQYSNISENIGFISYLLGGDTNLAVFGNLLVPNWFFEGDAVMSETILSGQGRGYLPSFYNEQKALLLNDIDYNYQKARNGSYKDMLPNHYPLGYAMVREGREITEVGDSWAAILRKTTSLHGLIYPFSSSTKKVTGLSTSKLYRKAYSDMKREWKKELAHKTISPSENVLRKMPKAVTSYHNMIFKNNQLFALRTSYNKTPQIVEISKGKERRCVNINHLSSKQFDFDGRNFIWSQVDTDPNYRYRSYSNLYIYDTQKRRSQRLTKKAKYFSPSFSPDGSQIIVSEYDALGKSQLVVLDAKTGKKLSTLKTYQDGLASYPKWDNRGKGVVYICSFNNQMALIHQTISTDKKDHTYTQLTPSSNHSISNFNITPNDVYFSASYSGTDNIYKVGVSGDRNITQVTNVEVGAYDPTYIPANQLVIYGDFTFKGTKLKQIDASYVAKSAVEVTTLKEVSLFPIVKGEQEEVILDDIPNRKYSSEPYNRVFNGIKLHSWGAVNVNNTTGLGIQADNILGDLSIGVNYLNNTVTDVTQYQAKIQYGKYPVKIGVTAGRESITESNKKWGPVFNGKNLDSLLAPTVDRIRLQLSKPFQTNTTNYGISANLQLGIGTYKYKKITPPMIFPPSTGKINENNELKEVLSEVKDHGIEYKADINFDVTRNMARMNLQPKFGTKIHMGYTLEMDQNQKEVDLVDDAQWNMETTLYLPGLMANDGFFVNGAFGKNDMSRFYQVKTSTFYEARGIKNIFTDQRMSLQTNYQLPICYPDFGIAGIFYIKRVRANLFYDLQFTRNISSKSSYSRYHSGGIELHLDTQWLNSMLIPIGVRYGGQEYRDGYRDMFIEFVSGFSF
ncbi:hypothetical protein K5X82_09205 [Halosquirtibacter xylanolyticus]|uniref:TolB family protein n=1 Tax=Halosquirtibacter xylanolyticus TaxID=3374599 RepID=UPI00374831E7|nr:hypothetical protein K5X82_09205 [Prolixibacteraceae bacterium]